MNDLCPVCLHSDPVEILDLGVPVPVLANRLHETADSARSVAVGDTTLMLCADCGHIWNSAFDAGRVHYDEGYENSLHFSTVFSSYADELAQHLVEHFDLRGRTLVEIGSGKGDFLRALCELGGNQGIGFDPSYSGVEDPVANLTFVPALFPDGGVDLRADFVYARHVLEHLEHPRTVLAAVRRSLGAGPAGMYVEVPDGGHMVGAPALWDLVYEHPAHFTASSLNRLLVETGFDVSSIGTSYGGQFLYAEGSTHASPSTAPSEVDSVARAQADVLSVRVAAALSAWDAILTGAENRGEQVLVWGAGSKGTTFLNIVPAARTAVAAIVDVNVRKHGRFVPGSGHEVVSPETAAALSPDTVLVMNPLYLQEVETLLRDNGASPRVVAVEAEPHFSRATGD